MAFPAGDSGGGGGGGDGDSLADVSSLTDYLQQNDADGGRGADHDAEEDKHMQA